MAAVTIDSVRLSSNPTSIPCPPPPPATTKFKVKAVVKGQGGQTVGSYDIKLYDLDPRGRKNLLDERLNVAVAAHLGFTKNHTFNLFCDDICEVNGPKGNSREMKPELRAIVTYENNRTKSSQKINVTCGAGSYKPSDKGRRK